MGEKEVLHVFIAGINAPLEALLSNLVREYCSLNLKIQHEIHTGLDPSVLEGKKCDLMILDLDTAGDNLLNKARGLKQLGSFDSIVVTYKEVSAERLLRAVRSGADDYLSYNPTIEEFKDVMQRVIGNKLRSRSPKLGKLISVFSNKGGVGTTMAAINLAGSVHELTQKPVVVVDLVLQHGDISVFLNVPTDYTTINLVNDLERADHSYLQSALPVHETGIHVLPAPYVPDEAELVSAEQVEQLLKILRQAFDAVVVDVGNGFNEHALIALEASDHTVLLTLPSLPSIRNTKRSLELFDRLGYDFSKITLVVNRHDAKEKVDLADLERVLGCSAAFSLPNDYMTVTRAINQGTTVKRMNPKAKISLSIDALVKKCILDDQQGMGSEALQPKKTQGFFGRKK